MPPRAASKVWRSLSCRRKSVCRGRREGGWVGERRGGEGEAWARVRVKERVRGRERRGMCIVFGLVELLLLWWWWLWLWISQGNKEGRKNDSSSQAIQNLGYPPHVISQRL
jgi:hypothetical protein